MRFLHLSDIHFLRNYPKAESGYNSIFITTSPVQHIVIQSEMNRMLVEHFGGAWIVNEEYVQFTIPFV